MKLPCSIICLLGLIVVGGSFSHVYANDFAGFPEPQADFNAHILEVEQYLGRTQMRQRKSSDVKYNLPFERFADKNATYRGKFFLIHGLNDSPYVFSDVAEELSARGFHVRAILLPGHGNTPEAQLTMSHSRWIRAAREQLNYFKNDTLAHAPANAQTGATVNEDAPMYLGGFSLGGVIATLLALENNDVQGLLLFSPAYKSSMNHLLRWSSIYAKFRPWVFGGMIIEDNPTKYNSIPINGAAQYYKTTKVLAKAWRNRQLSIPALLVASVDDSVVDVDFLRRKFQRGFANNNRRLILYSSTGDNADSPLIQYRNSHFPEARIINQSHQGVLMASQNPLFGSNGSVLVCNGNDWPTFSACLYSDEKHWFGAQHTPSPDGVPVARATYNPDFSYVFEQFDKIFTAPGG